MAQVGLLEDNARIANLCVTMLQYAGHRVTVYNHPQECLNALIPQAPDSKTHRYTMVPPLPIDVLVLDLHLPDIHGIEVIRLLRTYPHTQDLPLIFCTAATTAEIARALRLAPEADLVEKPFTFQMLTSTIAHALEIRE